MWTVDEIPKVYLMALCAWREARGCSVEAIRGVLHVIDNRARHPGWWGAGAVDVILKPKQFSSFNADNPEAVKFPGGDDRVFLQILDHVEQVLMGKDSDLTGGATHFHDSTVTPEWAGTMTRTAHIGTFRFYK